MADDKKNIPDSGKVDEPPSRKRWSLTKLHPGRRISPPPAKTEFSVAEGASKVKTPPGADKFTEVTIFDSQRLNNKNTAEEKSSAVFGRSVIIGLGKIQSYQWF